MLRIRQIGLIAGPLVFIGCTQLLPPAGLSAQGLMVLAAALWMAIWWTSEAVPMAVTAFIPLIVFPLLDLGSLKTVGSSYASKAVYLTLGGFIIGLALQRWQLPTGDDVL